MIHSTENVLPFISNNKKTTTTTIHFNEINIVHMILRITGTQLLHNGLFLQTKNAKLNFELTIIIMTNWPKKGCTPMLNGEH